MSTDISALDVSVVVPVYNPGRYIEVLVDGVLGQTLSRDRFEVLFVDDGSTDETPARLDVLAAEHDWISVIHQPNSGWPGKPRNVGLDAARGDYVFFSDHDDRLGPEALERMVATARRTGAEIVVPKMVNRGRGVPRELFRASNDDASLAFSPLSRSSVTPHKLFRRAWLDEHRLRFPEGRRRLEDGVFVVEAYLLAKRIAILADYPCYFRYGRDDGGNAGTRMPSPPEYFGNLEEIIDVIDRHTSPDDELRRSLYQRLYSAKLLGKLFGRRMFSWTPEMREAVYREVRSVIIRRFPVELAHDTSVLARAHLAALYAERLDRMVDVAGRTATLTGTTRLTRLKRRGGGWVIDVCGEITFGDGSPVRLVPVADGWAIDDRLIPAEVSSTPYAEAEVIKGAKLDVTVVDLSEGVEWFLDVDPTPVLVPIEDDPDGAHRLVLRARARLDPDTLACGRPLPPGSWSLRSRISSFGFSRDTPPTVSRRISAGHGLPVLNAGDRPELLALHRRRKAGTLTLSVDALKSLPVELLDDITITAGGRLDVRIAAVVSPVRHTRCSVLLIDDCDRVVTRRPARFKTHPAGTALSAELVDRSAGTLSRGAFSVVLEDDGLGAYVVGTVEVDWLGRVVTSAVVSPRVVTPLGDRPTSAFSLVMHRIKSGVLTTEQLALRHRDRRRTTR